MKNLREMFAVQVPLWFAVILIPLVFAISYTTKGVLLRSFLFALSVGVGLIPEMLPMVVNACLAHGSAVMGKKQTIVKNIDAMQSLPLPAKKSLLQK